MGFVYSVWSTSFFVFYQFYLALSENRYRYRFHFLSNSLSFWMFIIMDLAFKNLKKCLFRFWTYFNINSKNLLKLKKWCILSPRFLIRVRRNVRFHFRHKTLVLENIHFWEIYIKLKNTTKLKPRAAQQIHFIRN